MSAEDNLSGPQFFHGTDADLQPGQKLDSDNGYNYFTPHRSLAAEYARDRAGNESWDWDQDQARRSTAHVYAVQPSEHGQPDTNYAKGDSYYSTKPLTVVRKVQTLTGSEPEAWTKHTDWGRGIRGAQ